MLELIIHIISIALPTLVVYITYNQNKLNSNYFFTKPTKLSKYYYLVLFASVFYFSEYFMHLIIPSIDSLHEFISVRAYYLVSPNKYFSYDKFLSATIRNFIYCIPLTIFLYLSVNSLTKLKSFGITLFALFLVEPLQYLVNTITLSNYHYLSFLDILSSCLGATLGMAIIVFVPQITKFKKSICESSTS